MEDFDLAEDWSFEDYMEYCDLREGSLEREAFYAWFEVDHDVWTYVCSFRGWGLMWEDYKDRTSGRRRGVEAYIAAIKAGKLEYQAQEAMQAALIQRGE